MIDVKKCPGCGKQIILERPNDKAYSRLRHLIGECDLHLDKRFK